MVLVQTCSQPPLLDWHSLTSEMQCQKSIRRRLRLCLSFVEYNITVLYSHHYRWCRHLPENSRSDMSTHRIPLCWYRYGRSYHCCWYTRQYLKDISKVAAGTSHVTMLDMYQTCLTSISRQSCYTTACIWSSAGPIIRALWWANSWIKD